MVVIFLYKPCVNEGTSLEREAVDLFLQFIPLLWAWLLLDPLCKD